MSAFLIMIKACYTCTSYRQQLEPSSLRNSAGKVTGAKQFVDRCTARNMVELQVPVVDGTAIKLMLRAELVKLIDEAKSRKGPLPFIYGSEAQYHQGSTLEHESWQTIDCPLYFRKETLP